MDNKLKKENNNNNKLDNSKISSNPIVNSTSPGSVNVNLNKNLQKKYF